LINLYKSLIGSLIDYSFPCVNNLSNISIDKIQAIQNKALRFILRDFDTPNSRIVRYREEKGLMNVPNRLSELNEKYVKDALECSNPLIVRLVDEYGRGFSSRLEARSTPLSNLTFGE